LGKGFEMTAAPPTDAIDPDIWERLRELAGDRLLIPQGEACRALGIAPETLAAEIEAGRLRYVLVGARRKFKPSDLAYYIQQQERGPCVENLSSRSGPTGTAGILTFQSEVVDFATAVQRTPARTPRPSLPRSTPPPRLVESRQPPRRRRGSRSGKRSGDIGKPAVRT
jgi:hypothetical protein